MRPVEPGKRHFLHEEGAAALLAAREERLLSREAYERLFRCLLGSASKYSGTPEQKSREKAASFAGKPKFGWKIERGGLDLPQAGTQPSPHRGRETVSPLRDQPGGEIKGDFAPLARWLGQVRGQYLALYPLARWHAARVH
jgi:hypothetical protein